MQTGPRVALVAVAVRADVTQPDQCRYLVEAAREAFGEIDICIIGPGGGWHPEPVEQLDAAGALAEAAWAHGVTVNVISPGPVAPDRI